MAGLAGAYASTVYTPLWADGMIAGRGWIALALGFFGVALMLVCAGYARLKGYPVGARLPLKLVVQKVGAAIPSLFMIFLVIGGIVSGVFTATEAGAIAVVYSLVLAVGIYREVKTGELPAILMKSAETTAIVLALIRLHTATEVF